MGAQDNLLKLAECYVLEGEARITRLVALAARLSLSGHDTAEIETSIAELQVMLESMYEHLKVQQERYRSRHLGLSDM